MRVKNWIVHEGDARPAGKPDECFYCHQPIGMEHKTGCVIRSRTVVMEVTITLVREVPEHWDTDIIEFTWGQGTWCADNIIETLEKITEDDDHCLCGQFDSRYVREATAEDEIELGHTKGFSAGSKLLPAPDATERPNKPTAQSAA